MAGVFISYHRSESASALVRRIADGLDKRGITCWYDTQDPDAGYFAQTIVNEIENCRVFLFIWDEGSNDSEYCLREITTAVKRKPQAPVIIPFQVGTFAQNNRIAFYMNPSQTFNSPSPEDANIGELVNKIADVIGLKPLKLTLNSTDSKPKAKFFAESDFAKSKDFQALILLGICISPLLIILAPLVLPIILLLSPPPSYEWGLKKGVLTLSMEGNMKDYDYDYNLPLWNRQEFPPWYDRRKEVVSVSISDTVTSIGNETFLGCVNLKSVEIPENILFIGDRAFYGCKNLKSVSISNNITYIGVEAFRNCTSLSSLYIPTNVTHIRNGAFRGCTGLRSIYIPDSVIHLGEYAFADCSRLTEASVPANLEIGKTVFPSFTVITRRE